MSKYITTILILLFLMSWYIGLFLLLTPWVEGFSPMAIILSAYPLMGTYLCGPFWIIALVMCLIDKRNRDSFVDKPVKKVVVSIPEKIIPIEDRFEILDL
jgi:hypothetical protein